jgi:hypothetical protein
MQTGAANNAPPVAQADLAFSVKIREFRVQKSMNELTTQLIWQTARDNRADAKNLNDRFHWLLDQAWQAEIIDKLGVSRMQRAQQIWSWFHPEDFDIDGDDLWLTNWGIEIKLNQIVQRLIARHIRRNPEWELHSDYGDLPRRIVAPTPADVAELYPDELQAAIDYIGGQSGDSYFGLCGFLEQMSDHWIPTAEIIQAAEEKIKEQPTAGLPLFQEG